MNAHFLLMQEQRRVATRAAGAIVNIRRAASIREVTQAAHVSVSSMFHSIKHLFRDLEPVKQAASRRLDELVADDLEKIRATATAQDARELRGRYYARDWQLLRGTYSRQLCIADRESQKIISQKEKAERPAIAQQTD